MDMLRHSFKDYRLRMLTVLLFPYTSSS